MIGQTNNQDDDIYFHPQSNEINSDKTQHHEYFQNLEHKLILKSNKLSNFIGSNNFQKLIKTNSLNQNAETLLSSVNPYRKSNEYMPPSPEKKKIISPDKNIQPNNPKPQIKPVNQYNVDDAIAKLIRIKENLLKQKNYSRSSASSGQHNRTIAYDYNFTVSEPTIKEIIVNHETKGINAKQLLIKTLEQKKKMTETISTTSTISQFPKIDSPLLKKKQLPIVTLDDFKVIKPLGEGKFGTVFLAKHKQTNFLCALKRMSKIFQDQSIAQQLSRQIKIQSFLDHPNICQLYTFFEDQNYVYLVLQLCHSGNVYQLLRKQGRFPEEKVKSIIRQVSHAIQYLHQHDIIHRDIKPQNIILHESIIKLCDFGWSVYAPLSRGTLCGTPIYASPELVMKKQYDNKIDIWNIGILTYQLLFGRVPFEIRCEDDLQKVVLFYLIHQIEQEIYFPKSIEISELGKDFIRQCLNKNPKYRISIMKLLDHDFIYSKQSPRSH